MGWDGSGNVVRTDGTRTGSTVWDDARVADVDIESPGHDIHDEDLATAIENCLTRDGQNSPTANLPMNSKKHTGVADATAATEYATLGQARGLALPFVSASNVGGTADAITLTPSISVSSYATGAGFRFFIETQNTGAVTVAVSGLSAVTAKRADGTDFASGDLKVGRLLTIVYNGTDWITDFTPASTASGGISELYDDITTALSSITDQERFPVAAASVTGEPNRYVLGATLATYLNGKLSLNANKITAGTLASARLASSGTTGQVLKKTASGQEWADESGGSMNMKGSVRTTDFSTSSTSFVDGLTVSITPSSTSKKIRIHGCLYWGKGSSSDTVYFLVSHSNTALTDEAGMVRGSGATDGEPVNFCTMHSPGSTSAQTYKIRIKVSNSGETGYLDDGSCIFVEEF